MTMKTCAGGLNSVVFARGMGWVVIYLVFQVREVLLGESWFADEVALAEEVAHARGLVTA